MLEQKWRLTARDLEQMLSTAITDYKLSRVAGVVDELSVQLTLHTGKQMRLVAKMLLDEGLNRLCRSLALRREMDVYLLVLPEFTRIQEERGVNPRNRVDVFPGCAAARDSRIHDDHGGLAGEDSVLLLEDLRSQGYLAGDDVPELGLGEAEFVIPQLARFHATAVAFKVTKPLVFRNTVVRTLGSLRERPRGTSRMKSCLDVLKRREEFVDYLENITKFLDNSNETNPTTVYPFTTVIHDDFRKTNMMFKFNEQRKIVGFKIVNFGVACYGSPIADLLLFLFTSTEIRVVVEHLDSILRLYHDVFVSWLDELKCNAQYFTFLNFSKELRIFAGRELLHILSCVIPMANGSNVTENRTEALCNDNDILSEEDNFVQRALDIIKIFDTNEWI